jgi:branched-chain amino acid transport system substrate-binding protein
MSKRYIRLLALLSVLAMVVAACGDGGGESTTTEAPAAEPTTTEGAPTTTGAVDTTVPAFEPLYEGDLALGYLMPQTGALSAIAPSLQEAADMAVADAAAAGNSAITTSIKDDGTDPVIAGGATDELLNENVNAIIGPAATGVSLAVIDRITGAGIPMCSPSNTGAIFTTYEDNGFYFRTAPPDNLQGQVHGDLITEDGAISVAVAHRNDEYGLGLATAIRDQLEANGVEVPVFLEFDREGTSFDNEAGQIAAAGVDAISLHPFAEGNAFVQSLIEAGVGPADVQLYGGDGFLDNVKADTVEPGNLATLEGVRGTYPSIAPPDGEPTFGDRFAEFAGPDVPTIFSAHSYDCVMIMILAAEATGSTDPAVFGPAINDVTREGEKCNLYADCHALLQAGEDIDYDGAAGPLDFVDAGEPGAGTYDLVEYGADGTYTAFDTVQIP